LKSTNKITVTYEDHLGSDLSVVNAARVSFGKRSSLEEDSHGVWSMKDDDKRLIKYLAKHKHMSPFGHCFMSFHVKAPIFVARQLVKHKFLRWNEISRRYVDDEPEFYVPDVWRGRSSDKKQGSSGVVNPEYNPQYLDGKIKWAYFQALKEGVAPEQARMVLPQSTMTEWFWSGSLDAFADMCKLRLKEDTQYESRIVANQIDSIAKQWYPISWDQLVHSQ
jgi:thymidylate synthase (FAD)